MAFDISKLNIFNRLDARARVFVLLGAVIGVIFIIYLATKYFAGGSGTLGPSSVADVPQGLQTVPGGTQTQQFSKAVEQANLQRAQQAKISGTSAVPSMLNTQLPMGQSQCVICTEQAVDVKATLDDWVQKGKISPETAKLLNQLAVQNVAPEVYEDQLNKLVANGKLTPEQARELLAEYKTQHINGLLQESSKMMDDLIKRGQLPLAAANELLAMQKAGVSTADYAEKLQQLVRDGKISQATAQQLLAQYTQQRSKEAMQQGTAMLQRMVDSGEITPAAAKELADLQNKNVPVDLYQQTLDQMVKDGKITPAVAKKSLDNYMAQKGKVGPLATASLMLKNSEKAAYDEINDLMKANKMTPEVGALLTQSIQNDMPLKDYHNQIVTLVQQNKLTPEIAKLKYDDYQAVRSLRDMAAKLADLQANNASIADYEKALRDLAQAGVLTPEQAAQLMQEYQAVKSQPVAAAAPVSGPGTEEFLKLQQRLQQNAPASSQPILGPEDFVVDQAQTQGLSSAQQGEQEQIQALAGQMGGQAQQLVAAWQPTPMTHKEGAPEKPKDKLAAGSAGEGSDQAGKGSSKTDVATGPTLIKAGTIIFAVLDTAVNSDYPDSPVMATIVDGKYKGSKLMGKLTTTKGVAGQLDRVSLNFTLMNKEEWPKSKAVTAFAIDPDTARTVLASSVNYHYLQRFGAIMATSFVQGYASAIGSSSATTSTSALGSVSTTHPELSPSQKMATAIGQIGTALGSVTQGYTNIPPTVKVDSGVGLGILFMSDVS